MESLLEQYGRVRESYYGIPIDTKVLFCNQFSQVDCKIFIDAHFTIGAKHGVLEISEDYQEVYNREGKHQHTVSLYLLGLVLQREFSPYIKRVLATLMDNVRWYRFKYSWYLTCLYHDATSSIEKDIKFKDRISAVEKSLLFQHKPMKCGVNLLRFSKEVMLNYLEYRRTQREGQHRNEHGIIGGTQLFDALCSSFNEKTQGWDWNKKPVYRERNLKWRREHLDHFAYIADAVCCHNVWLTDTTNTKKCEEYMQAGLEALIVRQDKDKISRESYPLQFMLCLLDTIEPVKRFEKLPADIVLSNIYLKKNRNSITITWGQIIEDQSEFEDWKKTILGLPKWMYVKVPEATQEDEVKRLTIQILN